jgi:hypothetical protein
MTRMTANIANHLNGDLRFGRFAIIRMIRFQGFTPLEMYHYQPGVAFGDLLFTGRTRGLMPRVSLLLVREQKDFLTGFTHHSFFVTF